MRKHTIVTSELHCLRAMHSCQRIASVCMKIGQGHCLLGCMLFSIDYLRSYFWVHVSILQQTLEFLKSSNSAELERMILLRFFKNWVKCEIYKLNKIIQWKSIYCVSLVWNWFSVSFSRRVSCFLFLRTRKPKPTVSDPQKHNVSSYKIYA